MTADVFQQLRHHNNIFFFLSLTFDMSLHSISAYLSIFLWLQLNFQNKESKYARHVLTSVFEAIWVIELLASFGILHSRKYTQKLNSVRETWHLGIHSLQHYQRMMHFKLIWVITWIFGYTQPAVCSISFLTHHTNCMCFQKNMLILRAPAVLSNIY